jgi:lipopolysaccharide transport system permease protein
MMGREKERAAVDVPHHVHLSRPGEAAAGRQSVEISPDAGSLMAELREVWHARELLAFLIWRDVKVRYKQTVLGIAWAVIQPLFLMLVFSVFLGRLAGMPSDGLPYPVFVLCGLVPWQLFSHAVNGATMSVVENERLITKVYFPRVVIPIAAVMAGVVDFGIAFLLLLAVMLFFGMVPGPLVLLFPIFVIMALSAAVGVGVWLAAINVKYRDVRYTVPFLLQLWLFATPIAYPASIVQGHWQILLSVINPLTSVIAGFRWVLLGAPAPDLLATILSAGAIISIGIGGLIYFRRAAYFFADVI